MRADPFKHTFATTMDDFVSATATLTRPADTTAYTAGDAMTDSTETPTILTLDFGTSVKGSMLEVSRVEIVSKASPATLLTCSLLLSPVTFAGTNDNAALAITEASLVAGMVVVPVSSGLDCGTPALLYANSLSLPIKLAAASSTLYAALVATNAYAAASAETFKVRVWAKVCA
jgi:hypothetical protein